MTREEAIENLQSYAYNSWGELNEAFKTAIEALEKQIPKKPTLAKTMDILISFYPCPNCSTAEECVSVYPQEKYCSDCGQKLDWSDTE